MNGTSIKTNGIAGKNDIVTYEDQANPRQAFLVLGTVTTKYGPTEYALLNLDTDENITSDLRQHGWSTHGNIGDVVR